ncbi:phospholipase A2 inhibitor beta-like isoform X2 [Ischnura elegans]|uniref:phospholipase A2 inhibitor beta-like isoform X2 n=1 Tax=Ischnura elegans TaxID=197161 RepID=UPI001ED89693|nr:phospholipase A2 inhibitor beta-like isoform X2 [Ischnura elegans]
MKGKQMGFNGGVYFGFVVINILVSCVSADAGNQVLCQWCACVTDKSSWMPDKEPGLEGRPHKSDPNALLVNCSGLHASPFAGDYVWPDVPLQNIPDPNKSPDVPATRADFSSSGLNGVMKNLPVKETRRLRELSLAHNQITTILPGSLTGLPALMLLDLSHNKLANLPQDTLPLASDPSTASNLKVLLLSHNEFLKFPWEARLRLPMLEWLDVSSNFIKSLENGFNGKKEDLTFKTIEVLNLKHNRLTELSSNAASRFPNLKVLDLSWNSILVVPDAFLAQSNSTFRNLSELNLDGNPIKRLGSNSFLGSPFLHLLSLSASAELSEISSEAFDGLEDLRVLKLRKNILLSRLPAKGILREVNETGGRRALEEVDLSYNSLEYITPDFIPWKKINRVNLQGNPWNCNCSLQWMLDKLMPRIYKTDSKLLMDLRCSKPRWLLGRRFVHWLGRSNGVYCGHKMEKLRMGLFPQEEVEDVDVVAMGMGPWTIAVIVSAATLVVGLIVLAIIWQRRALRIEKEKRTRNYQCRNPRY